MPVLQYYFVDGSHVIFNKYIIDNGIIKNKKGDPMAYTKSAKIYNTCSVTDDCGKRRNILVGRAIVSSIHGPPPSLAHTADHKDKNPENDTDENLRWLCKSGQVYNREMPETYKSAFVIVKDGIEKTIKGWVEYLKDNKNHMGREYTGSMINRYARKKLHGFAFKEYPDLLGEIWKEIADSKTIKGHWKISNMSRVKYITKYTEHVLSGERLCLRGGYPAIRLNGKIWLCHILAFMTFFPDDYAAKKTNELILHEDDDKMDFRPHKLRIGTQKENTTDAHDNGCHDDTQRVRMRCVSYINDIFEKEHDSQHDAIRYLKTKSIGYDKATDSNISKALNPIYKSNFAYGRTWKLVE